MKFLEKLRQAIFWGTDYLKGQQIRKHFDEVKFIMENYNDPKAIALREENLEAVIKHATRTTPFYRDYADSPSLNDFPVINKKTINDHIDLFKSDVFIGQKNYPKLTSGSTGTPFKTYHNNNKRLRNTADTIYFSKIIGFEIGYKLVYIRHWDRFNSKSKIMCFLQNILMHPVLDLSPKDIGGLIDKMTRDSSNKGILSYASALDVICQYLDANHAQAPLKCNVKSVVAMSEKLSDYAKSSMEKYFGAPVISRYSNVENGIIAQQAVAGKTEFYINGASYHVEILEMKSDTPVAPGKLGRIVVTDLFNYCMPMLRYDTGDVGTMDTMIVNGIEVPVLKRVEGRKMDMIFNTSGEYISSFAIMNLLKYSNINQFQLIQEGERFYRLKLNVSPEFDSEENIVEEFKGYLGDDAEIVIDYVKEIPLLSSGKRKLVLNTFI